MKDILQQFVPSAVCLTCDGCCRYKEEQSPWRPKLGEKEKASTQKSSLAGDIFSKATDKQGYLKAVACSQGLYRCIFFNLQNNTCGIYSARPFECQLYPFVLTKQEEGAAVYVHLNCPFVQMEYGKQSFKEYVHYLKEYFSKKTVRAFLKENPSLIGDYSQYQDELEFVFGFK